MIRLSPWRMPKNHERGGQPGIGQLLAGCLHAGCVVIGLFAAAQNHMAIGVAAGVNNGGLAAFADRQEVMLASGCANGVNGNFHVAIRAVFEAHGQIGRAHV